MAAHPRPAVSVGSKDTIAGIGVLYNLGSPCTPDHSPLCLAQMPRGRPQHHPQGRKVGRELLGQQQSGILEPSPGGWTNTPGPQGAASSSVPGRGWESCPRS